MKKTLKVGTIIEIRGQKAAIIKLEKALNGTPYITFRYEDQEFNTTESINELRDLIREEINEITV